MVSQNGKFRDGFWWFLATGKMSQDTGSGFLLNQKGSPE